MIPLCDMEAPVAAEVEVAQAGLRGDAACLVPSALRDEIPRDPTRGEVRLVSAMPIWIAVDGVAVPIVSPGPLDLTLRLAPGPHLVEVGTATDRTYAVTLAADIEAASWTGWAVVPLIDHLDVVTCPEGLAEEADLLAQTDLTPGQRRWVSERFGGACLAHMEPSFDAASEQAVVAARAGWEELATSARELAFQADLRRFASWQEQEVGTAGWMRAGEWLGVGGYLALEGAVASGTVPQSRTIATEWGARGALGGMLLSSLARRQALVRAGQPTPKTAMMLGGMALLLSTVRPPPTRLEGPWVLSGASRLAALGLGVVQIIENERAQRRARKLARRLREAATEGE